MANESVSWITGYIWGIADDVLHDLYVRGKYRDVILPMKRSLFHLLRVVLAGALCRSSRDYTSDYTFAVVFKGI